VKSGCPLKRNNNGIYTAGAHIEHNRSLQIGVPIVNWTVFSDSPIPVGILCSGVNGIPG